MIFSKKSGIAFPKQQFAAKDKRLRYAAMAYIAMFVVTELLRSILQYNSVGDKEANDFLFSSFAQIIGMYGLPLLIIYAPEWKTLKPLELTGELGYRSTVKWWVYLVAVVIGFVMPIISMGVNVIANAIMMMLGFQISPVTSDLTNSVGIMIAAVFFTAVLPAICEEGLHRGILVRAMRPHYSDKTMILMTALLFSLMHSYIRQTFYTFVFGIICGVLAVKTKSIWAAMIVHFVNNAYLTIGDYVTEFNWFGSGFTDAMNNAQSYVTGNLVLGVFVWIVAIAAVVGMLFAIVKFGRKGVKRGEKQPVVDEMTGQRLVNGRALTRVSDVDRVWYYGAILCGVLFTLLSVLQHLV